MKCINNKIYLNPAKDRDYLIKVVTSKYEELVKKYGEILYCEFNISSEFEVLSLEYAINNLDKPIYIKGEKLISLIEAIKGKEYV